MPRRSEPRGLPGLCGCRARRDRRTSLLAPFPLEEINPLVRVPERLNEVGVIIGQAWIDDRQDARPEGLVPEALISRIAVVELVGRDLEGVAGNPAIRVFEDAVAALVFMAA